MKKLFQVGAFFIGILMVQGGFAMGNNGPGCGQENACPPEQPCGQPVDCWCRYVRYEPCYYCEKRCVEEQIPCKRKCTRMVPRYYEVQRCRYVPQYYKETICRNEPECYYVDECRTCKRWVSDTKCRYVPKYYWKHTCGDNSGCARPCPR